jgi:formylmethanofuran--tetrahydromethanopterin N-formyltransferase
MSIADSVQHPAKEGAPRVVNGVKIDDTFAEAFGMSGTGLVLTADSAKWAMQAAVTMTGFGTSVIGCGAECGIDRVLSPDETPDGRPGVRVLLFGFSPDSLGPQLKNRVGQCVLTSPGSACYNGLEADKRLPLSNGPRFFGDGWQTAKRLGKRRFWRVPVMDGEFAAVEAIAKVRDVITPFPGGIVRSGSKVGSKYKGAMASTNDAFCPTLRGAVRSECDADTVAVLEIVIDGLTSQSVADAMRAGLKAVIDIGAKKGVTRVSAGNYGGKLGQHHYHLKDLIA